MVRGLKSARMLRARMLLCSALLCTVVLTACAGARLIDSDVRSYRSAVAPVAAGSYQFERLPSQMADASGQAQRENWAVPVLQRMGLDLVSDAPRYTVQLGVTTEQVLRKDPGFARRWGGLSGGGLMATPHVLVPLEPMLYRYTVQVLVRDAQSREVVYEASAQHTGPWSDQDPIVPAVLLAAMRDFPQGSAGSSNVKVQIGPGGMAWYP